MKQKLNGQIGIPEKSQANIKNKEKKLEISIYALIIIVTVALMLIFFNLILRN
jgi:flagellar basal body-associated protein FliL